MSLANKRLVRILSVMIALFVALSVVGLNTETYAATKAKKLTLKTTSKYVDIKGKVTVSVKSVSPKKASKAVTWKSSNKKVATVTSKGVVKGVKKGYVYITATSKSNKKVKAKIKIYVKDLKSTSVSVSGITRDYNVGETVKVKGIVRGATGYYNQGYTLSSSDPEVVKVSSTGVVTCVAPGTAKIIAKAKDSGHRTGSVTINVCDDTTCNYIKANELGDNMSDYVIIDVRKSADYELAHIVGAKSYSVDSLITEESAEAQTAEENIKTCVAENGKTAKYAVICYSGNRYAKAATTLLISNGVRNANIMTLEGGMGAWYSSKYDIEPYNKVAQEDFAGHESEYVVLDVRKAADFAEAKIDGSINADCDGAVTESDVAGAEANIKAAIEGKPADTKYAVVCYSGNRYAKAATKLLIKNKVSNSNIYTLTGGFNEYKKNNDVVISRHYIGPATLQGAMSDYVILDVRQAADYNKGHIPGAISADCDGYSKAGKDPSATAESSIANIKAAIAGKTADTKYAVICYSGNAYATAATKILVKEGVNPANIFTLGAADGSEASSAGGMAGWNAAGYDVEPAYFQISQADFAGHESEYVVLDVRKAADFAEAHIKDSVNADCDGAVTGADKAAAVANIEAAIADKPADAKYAVICYSGNRYAKEATKILVSKNVAVDNICTLTGGFNEYKKNNDVEISRHYIGPATLQGAMSDYVILDVRQAADYNKGHIPGAISADCDGYSKAGKDPSATAESSIANIKAAIAGKEASTKYAVICYSGNAYATAATKILVKEGVNPANIFTLGAADGSEASSAGGMAGWNAAGYDVEPAYFQISQADFAGHESEYVVLDVRKAADFADAHIKDAVNADCDGAVTGADKAAAVANIEAAIEGKPADAKYAVICYSGNRYAKEATKILVAKDVSVDNIYTLTGGFNEYKKNNDFDYAKHEVSQEELVADAADYLIIDARMKADYDKGHIPGSVSADCNDYSQGGGKAPNGTVQSSIDNLTEAIAGKDVKTVKIAIACYSGNRYAEEATKALIRLGVTPANIYTLTGGMGAWTGDKELTYYYITADELAGSMSSYRILDVRKKADYDASHVAGAISADCNDYNAGADKAPSATAQSSIDNIKAAMKDGSKYVLVCYSGNKYAKAATQILLDNGVAPTDIVTLQGGQAEAVKVCPIAFGNVTADPAKKTVTFKATVNGNARTINTMHFIVNKDGGAAKNALMTTSVSPANVSDALHFVGATAWDEEYVPAMGTDFTTVKAAAAKGLGNSEYSHVAVSVDGKTMGQVLKSYTGYDSVFANAYNPSTNGTSGCITCNTSCYFGVVADNNKTIAKGFYANTTNIAAGGKTVTVVITLK